MTRGKRHDLIVNTSVVVTIVAVGIVIAGVLPQSDVAAEADSAGMARIVSEPVEFPVDIPGCDEVQPPPQGDASGVEITASIGGEEPSYDNPAYPWLTASKASVMSDAVRAALPTDVTLRLAAPSQSLTFQPVVDYGETGLDSFAPASRATAELVRGDRSGYTSVAVAPWSAGAPDCVAGSLDSRTNTPDGAVVDTLDTWFEIDGTRSYSRTVTAYRSDGTRVTLQISPTSSPNMPLEVDEAMRIVSLPDLSVTEPVPAETAAPRRDCSVYAAQSAGTVKDIRQESVDAANAALTATWAAIPNAPTLDRPIGSLVPDGFSSGVCTDVDVVGTRVGLSVSVIGGQPLPVAVDPYDPNAAYGPLPETRTLPDGSVVQSEDAGIMQGLVSEDGTTRLARSVTLTRTDGVQVSVRSTADVDPTLRAAPLSLPDPLGFDLLDALVRTPIAVWP